MAPESAESNEAVLTGVMALANLFSNCVEAFNLIRAVHTWNREEQLLLCKLGLQQARLLIWGDVTGISSPPASITDRAVPKHPSGAYPDITEPTFFGPRDPRLDETETRIVIENKLSGIVDKTGGLSREEMMARFGLKPPRRLGADHYQTPLDQTRLEAFRERYELLQEVAATYAHISSAKRNASLTQVSWIIADEARFGAFIELARESIDTLIELMDVRDRVDRAMRMDIKVIGWHLAPDRVRVSNDRAKLRLLHETCREQYPEYVGAVEIALANIEKEFRECAPVAVIPPPSSRKEPKSPRVSISKASGVTASTIPVSTDQTVFGKQHSNGLFGGLLKGLRRGSKQSRSASLSFETPDGPERSKSESGPRRTGAEDENIVPPLQRVRSKSIGAYLDPGEDEDEEGNNGVGPKDVVVIDRPGDHAVSNLKNPTAQGLKNEPAILSEEIPLEERLRRIDTDDTVELPPEPTSQIFNVISRHDQYHGIGRQGTKNQ